MKNLTALFCLFLTLLRAQDHPELKAYPPAEEGQVRHVIVLPYLADEEDHQVEILVGKILTVDGVNHMRMGGKFEEKTVEGWGYNYYSAVPGPVASTLMAPPPGMEQVERFVSMPGKMVRYNSKLPVVIYTPDDVTVRYRIWSAGETRSIK